jgi:hypothetical protein
MAQMQFDDLNLLVEEGGSNSARWCRRGRSPQPWFDSRRLPGATNEAPLAPKACENEINSRGMVQGPQWAPNMVEAPGIENESSREKCTIQHQYSAMRHSADSGSVSFPASKCANARGARTELAQTSARRYDVQDVVEPALARALVLAAHAQQWDVVALIATELKVRREGREPDGDRHPRTSAATPRHRSPPGRAAR